MNVQLLLIKYTENMKILEEIMEYFAQVSGLKMNRHKTQIMKLGSSSIGNDNLIVITLGKMVYLVKKKWSKNEILGKIKILLERWKQRNLTILGNIKFVKVLQSLNYYVYFIMSVPPRVFKEVETISFNFVCSGHDKIKRKHLFVKYDTSGLKMLNFKYMIYAQLEMWTKRLVCGNNDMTFPH